MIQIFVELSVHKCRAVVLRVGIAITGPCSGKTGNTGEKKTQFLICVLYFRDFCHLLNCINKFHLQLPRKKVCGL